MEWSHPSIIALKGFPFTGKTSLSAELAHHLRFCLLLNLDGILDPISAAAGITSRPSPAKSEELIGQAFELMCGQAEQQVSIGQSVIIDSLPLSRAHLDRLAGLSKLVVVECQIDRTYAWEMRFKKQYPGNSAASLPWYKARNWDEVLDTVKGYDKRLDEQIQGVSRLYLNVDQRIQGRHVIEAIQTLVFCPHDRHLDYQKWNNYRHSDVTYYKHDHDHTNCGHNHYSRVSKTTSTFCHNSHRIGVFMAEGLVDYEADCLVCDNPVTGPAYTCSSCWAAVHKFCAELKSSSTYTPQDFPSFIKEKEQCADDNKGEYYYSFSENIPCFNCRESGEEFSDDCSGCIYKSLLKCRLFPAIIEHDGHPHRLILWAGIIKSLGEFTCMACREKGAYAGYTCYGCSTSYHMECALLPYPIRDHKHGGHQHTLKLMFKREDKEFDDFPCSYCLTNMSPEDWYYYCDLCDQTYHLKCAFLDEDATTG